MRYATPDGTTASVNKPLIEHMFKKWRVPRSYTRIVLYELSVCAAERLSEDDGLFQMAAIGRIHWRERKGRLKARWGPGRSLHFEPSDILKWRICLITKKPLTKTNRKGRPAIIYKSNPQYKNRPKWDRDLHIQRSKEHELAMQKEQEAAKELPTPPAEQ